MLKGIQLFRLDFLWEKSQRDFHKKRLLSLCLKSFV